MEICLKCKEYLTGIVLGIYMHGRSHDGSVFSGCLFLLLFFLINIHELVQNGGKWDAIRVCEPRHKLLYCDH